MAKKEGTITTVYVTKDFETRGIYEDTVTNVGRDRYKSTKFRYTYYSESDFQLSQHEAEQFTMRRYGIHKV